MMLIFELDGGSWTAIGPLLEQGRLPNIAGLICRGASGVLRSIPPLLSPAVWTTIYTGQPRERHGVQTFDATSEDVRYKRLWDIAYANGIICGVCGSLVTWPPYNVGGFMIPDIMARDARTIPPQFASLQELVLKYPSRGHRRHYGLAAYPRYAVQLPRAGIKVRTMIALAQEVLTAALLRHPHRDTYWRRAILLQQLYADAFLRLYHTYRPALSTYHYHAVDTLSHLYWEDFVVERGNSSSDNKGHREALTAAYQSADRILGKFLQAAGPGAVVLVISDHGFCRNPEPWPRYRVRLPRLIQILGLEGIATPTRLAHQHFLYFRDSSHVEDVGRTLRSAHFKETGEVVLPRVVTRGTSLFFPPPNTSGGGLTVVLPGHAELPFEELFEDTGHVATGIHDPEGIVILAGPAVYQGVKLKEASILDVAPTALALLGLPVARDMRGRIWTEAIHPQFWERFPLTVVDTYRREERRTSAPEISDKDVEILYQRLQHLGYL